MPEDMNDCCQPHSIACSPLRFQLNRAGKVSWKTIVAAALAMALTSCGSNEPRPHASVAAEPVQTATQTQQSSNVQASQAPGQYDVLVGTAVQLRAQPPAGSNEVTGYRWEIVEGQGGRLLNSDSADVTFVAREVPSAIETFVIRVTSEYAGGKPATADMIVRVHRQAPAQSNPAPVRQRYGYSPWFYGAVGFGVGYVWNYPIYVPIVIPPPEEIWPPEKIPPVNPEPLPPEEIDKLPEDLHPPELLPADVEFPEPLPLPVEDTMEAVSPLPDTDIPDNPAPIIDSVEEPTAYPIDPDPPEAGSDWGFRDDVGGDFGGDFEDDMGGDFGGDFGDDMGGDFGGDF